MLTINSRYYLKQFKAQAYISDVKVIPSMPETLGEIIRRRMKDLNISTASELARQIGVSSAYASDLINDAGKTRSGTYTPSFEVIKKLAEVLRLPEAALLKPFGVGNGSSGLDIDITDDIRLVLLGKDISPEDRDEYERAVSLAVAMAKQRIEDKKKP